jgi:hypothetical protein
VWLAREKRGESDNTKQLKRKKKFTASHKNLRQSASLIATAAPKAAWRGIQANSEKFDGFRRAWASSTAFFLPPVPADWPALLIHQFLCSSKKKEKSLKIVHKANHVQEQGTASVVAVAWNVLIDKRYECPS